MKVCLEPGCPSLQRESRCLEHRRGYEQQRGSRTERGYGAEHQAQRALLAPLVATGNVKCWRCGEYIAPSAGFDLGHDDQDRTRYRGPECRPCNRATSGRTR